MSEVMLVRWPDDGEDGSRLARAGVAVLYLVNADDDPPTPRSCLEDWVRIPGDDRDLLARVAALELRADAHRAAPRVDDDGRLHYHGKVLVLPAGEIHLARLLTERFGDVVPDSDFGDDETASDPALRVRMTQLRARLRELDLTLHRVRRRGYTLVARQ
jgi:DNA-binding response OmpR family regulator